MYTSVVNDPKVQRLSPILFKGWVNLLCIAGENNGQLPGVSDLAFTLRTTERKVQELIKSLSSHGLIVDGKPHNWDSRQFQSDSSTERVKRFRERSGNAEETPSEQNRTDTEQKEPPTPLQGDEGITPKIAEKAMEIWNHGRGTLPPCKTLTAERRKKIKTRCSSGNAKFLTDLKEATAKVSVSEFAISGTWCSFDWMIKNGTNMQKVLEGHYETGHKPSRQGDPPPRAKRSLQGDIAPAEDWEAALQHDRHWCSSCESPHFWPCSEAGCGLSHELACQKYREELRRNYKVLR